MNKSSKTRKSNIQFKVMNIIHKHPSLSQREIAIRAGISLGSIHYCLKALIEKGWIKVENFKKNPKKSSYLYLLTSEGVIQKSKLAYSFLITKINEHKAIKKEIETLSKEINYKKHIDGIKNP